MPQIEVEFALDANGILTVTAVDKASGKKADIKITNSGGLDKSEIERMKRDAEAHASEDKARRELVDLKNKADAVLIQTRKALEEHGGKVSAEVRGKVESSMTNLEGRIKSDDKAAIEAALNELEKSSMELGKIMYEEAAKKGQPGSEAEPKAGGTAKDDVIDAEFKVKEDEKK
jgi:molecular chaperone DnaK